MKRRYYFCLFAIVAALASFVGVILHPAFLEHPADTEVIGVKHVENANGILYVDMDTAWVLVESVYTGTITTRELESQVEMQPVAGMEVTVFKLDGKLQFIAGKWTKEGLDIFFGKTYLFAVLFFIALFCMFMVINARDLRKGR